MGLRERNSRLMVMGFTRRIIRWGHLPTKRTIRFRLSRVDLRVVRDMGPLLRGNMAIGGMFLRLPLR